MLVTITVCTLAAAAVGDWLVFRHAGHGGHNATRHNPDATVFISTLVLIYTVLLTVYGATLPQVVDSKKSRGPWTVLMVVLTVGVAVIDLWRIQNSLGDLYATTNRTLTPAEIQDVYDEFVHYWFWGNVTLVVLLLITLAWPRRLP